MIVGLRRGSLALAVVFGPTAAALGQGTPKADPPKEPTAVHGDPVAPFVAKVPRTAEDRVEIEAILDYTAARSLEDRRLWGEAIARYQDGLKKRPNSIAILRRLCGLCFALGRADQAIEYSRRALDLDPGDVGTLERLFAYYVERKKDSEAEALLKGVLANPRLAADSPAALVANRDLGDLYSERLGQPDKAADAYQALVVALDAKGATHLAAVDQRRLFKGDEADAYLRFGDALARVRRFEPAIRAYQRGLAYDAENVRLPSQLARALFEAGRSDDALKALEPYLRKQPPGLDGYDLLGKILHAQGRDAEYLPRLVEAARDDRKNVALQFALSEAYRKDGQAEKAEAILKTLLNEGAGDPQILGALAQALYREKKTDDLIKIIGEAVARENGFEAIRPTIDAILKDGPYADALVDRGIQLQSEEPPALSRNARMVLSLIATQAKKPEKRVVLQRLALRQEPNVMAYRELLNDLFDSRQFDEAVATIDEMMARFPDEKNAMTYVYLARAYAGANKIDKALAAADESLKMAPDFPNALLYLGYLHSKIGQDDKAIDDYQTLLKKYADNAEVVKRARSGLSVAYVNQSKLREGEKELEILLEKEPDDPGINNDLGYLYADQGKDLERAEGMIRKALEEEPENASYLDSLGWALYRRGKLSEALVPLEKASKDADIDATIHDHLGDVYFSLKDAAKAKAAWQAAEKIAAAQVPPDRKLPSIRKKLAALNERGVEPSTDSPRP